MKAWQRWMMNGLTSDSFFVALAWVLGCLAVVLTLTAFVMGAAISLIVFITSPGVLALFTLDNLFGALLLGAIIVPSLIRGRRE